MSRFIVVVGATFGLVFGGAAALPGLAPRAGQAAVPPVFDGNQVLPGQGGGEPSIAIDTGRTSSRNNVYIESIGGWGSTPPQGRPAGSGPVIWRSTNLGQSFSQPVPFDTFALNALTSGGDADVVVAPNGNVIVNDLNVTYAWVQVSTDHAQTFNTGTPTAFEDDRPWLTVDGSTVYVYYHDFVAEFPVICKSTDGGLTFGLCSPLTITDPTAIANCAENTIPARPLSIDPVDKSLNVLFACSTAPENLANPPYGTLHDYYLAKSTDGGVTWTDYLIFTADSSGGKHPNFANIFSNLGVDSAGNYYALWSGSADDNNTLTYPFHVWLAVSKDHGQTWGKPIVVDSGIGTTSEAHFVATGPGQLDVVFYGTDAVGEPNGYCGSTIENQVSVTPCNRGFARFDNQRPKEPLIPPPNWQVYMAQTMDGTANAPTFTQVKVNQSTVHVGEICTNGLVCGSSDRSLLDFLSVAVDCNGSAHIAYASNTVAQEIADFANGAADIRSANQVAGSTISPPSACSAPAVVSQPSASPAPVTPAGMLVTSAGGPAGPLTIPALATGALVLTLFGLDLVARRRRGR